MAGAPPLALVTASDLCRCGAIGARSIARGTAVPRPCSAWESIKTPPSRLSPAEPRANEELPPLTGGVSLTLTATAEGGLNTADDDAHSPTGGLIPN
jgi:hypothetical protein